VFCIGLREIWHTAQEDSRQAPDHHKPPSLQEFFLERKEKRYGLETKGKYTFQISDMEGESQHSILEDLTSKERQVSEAII
jgi:hypothetical protein